jgi:hypothetical protein
MAEKEVEVKQEDNREIGIGESRVCLGEDNIIYAIPIGDIDEKIATSIIEAIRDLMNIVGENVNGIVDLNKCGEQSPKARKIFRELNDDKRVGRLAFIGMHPVARVLASFAMGISRNKNLRFFKSKEDALVWLKE